MHTITKSRVQLLRALQANYAGFYPDETDKEALFKLQVIQKIRKDKEGYLAFSNEDPMMVSYAQRPEYRLCPGRRVKTTLQRYIRRRLGIANTIPDHRLDQMYRDVFASRTVEVNEKQFTVLEGQEIVDAYDDCVGGGTCMTGDNSDCVRLYALNPDKVKLLVYRGSARALLWTCEDGARVMDRIYPNDGGHTAIMRQWARDHGYLTREDNRMPSGNKVPVSDGHEHTVLLTHDGAFPYMDTFHFGEIEDRSGKLYASNFYFDGCGYLEHTDGSGPDLYECNRCGCSISERNSYEFDGNYWCSSCYKSELFDCQHCGTCHYQDDGINARLYRGGRTYDVVWCQECADENTFYCEGCNTHIHGVPHVLAEDTDRSFCPECAQERTGTCADCGTTVEKLTECAHCHLKVCDSCIDSHITAHEIPSTSLQELEACHI